MEDENKCMKILVGERGSGKTFMMRDILHEIGKKERIKDIIKSCFNEKHISLSSEELEQEYKIVKEHIKLKHSHHLNSKYRLEHIIEMRKVLNIVE